MLFPPVFVIISIVFLVVLIIIGVIGAVIVFNPSVNNIFYISCCFRTGILNPAGIIVVYANYVVVLVLSFIN